MSEKLPLKRLSCTFEQGLLTPCEMERAIDKLPNEILVQIYLYVQSEFSPKKPWYRLMRVCKRWSAVIRVSPVLWRFVRIEDNAGDLDLLRYSLTYSGDMLVDIVCLFASEFALIAPLILRHAHRIRSLRLLWPPYKLEHAVASLMYHDMPALEELELELKSGASDGDEELPPLNPEEEEDERGNRTQYPFFWVPKVEQFPRLTRLSLGRRIGYSLRFPAIPTLKYLELDHCVTKGTITLAAFIGAYLARLPVLEELILVCLDLTPSPGSGLKLPPMLRKFKLEDFPLRIASSLSSLAPLPADLNVHLTRLVCYVEPHMEPETPLTALYSLPRNRDVLPILDLVETAVIRQHYSEVYSIMGTTAAGASVEISGEIAEDSPEPYDFLADVADAFRNAPLRELRVDNHYAHKLEEPQWVRTLLSFPHLQRIAVLKTWDDEYDARRGLLKALCSTPSVHGAAVPCPELQSLTLVAFATEKDREVADEMLCCVKHRSSNGSRLKHLHIVIRDSFLVRPLDPVQIDRRRDMFIKMLEPWVETLDFERTEGLSY